MRSQPVLVLALILLALAACAPAAATQPNPTPTAAATETPASPQPEASPTAAPTGTPAPPDCTPLELVSGVGTVHSIQVGGPPEALRVLYVQEAEDGDPPLLLSLPIEGGEARVLGEIALREGADQPAYALAAGGRVLFAAPEGKEALQLRSAPLDGGSALVLGQVDFPRFDLSPDGSWVLFTPAGETGSLRSASVNGEASSDLTGEIGGEYAVVDYVFGPDQHSMVLHLRQGGQSTLYQTAASGGALAWLGSFTDLGQMAISPDGLRLVLTYGYAPGEWQYLRTITLEDRSYQEVAWFPYPGVTIEEFVLSADSEWIAYRLWDSPQRYGWLYRSPIQGGPEINLAPSSLGDVIYLRPIPGGNSIMFATRVSDSMPLYASRFEENSFLPLVIGLTSNGLGGIREDAIQFGPDGDYLLTIGTTSSFGHLVQVDLRSAERITLTEEIENTPRIARYLLSPDGQWVTFITQDGRLYLISTEGGTPALLASGLDEIEPPLEFSFSPASDWLVYSAGDQIGAAPVSCAAP